MRVSRSTSARATARRIGRSSGTRPRPARSSRSTGSIGQFPTTADRFRQGYAESVSAVDYMVRTYGTDALVALIRSYADGRTDDEAFKAALGVDMTAFADAWLADVKAKQPTRYGPQPAPSGPVPAAWAGRPAAWRPSAPPVVPLRRPRRALRRRPRPAPTRTPRPTCRPGWRRWWRASGSSSSWSSSSRHAATGRRTSGHDLGRAAPARDPELAGHARRGAPGARLPDRRPARVRGPAGPLHDAGANAAGRDRHRAADRAGRPQGPDPPAPRPDPGRREPGRGGGRPRPAAQREARAGADRGRADRAHRQRDRPPARGLEGAGPAGRQRVRLPGRFARHPGRRRGAVGRRRRGDRGQRRADHADLRDHRHRQLAAGQLGLPRAALPDQRARAGRPLRPAQCLAWLRRLRPCPERWVRHPRLDRRAPVGRHPGLRRDGHPALLAAARVAVGRRRP